MQFEVTGYVSARLTVLGGAKKTQLLISLEHKKNGREANRGGRSGSCCRSFQECVVRS
jgi:hypothetical protein